MSSWSLLKQGGICFFNPLMQMHKGEWCCGSAGRRAVLLPGDPTAITEDTFQWMTNKKLPPRL